MSVPGKTEFGASPGDVLWSTPTAPHPYHEQAIPQTWMGRLMPGGLCAPQGFLSLMFLCSSPVGLCPEEPSLCPGPSSGASSPPTVRDHLVHSRRRSHHFLSPAAGLLVQQMFLLAPLPEPPSFAPSPLPPQWARHPTKPHPGPHLPSLVPYSPPPPTPSLPFLQGGGLIHTHIH